MNLKKLISTYAILIGIIVLGLIACEKEDNDNHFRLIRIDNHTNGISSGGTRFIYDGTDIWKILTKYHDGDSLRIEYYYPEADKAVESYYYFNGFSWSYKKKIEYMYQGKYINQIIDYEYDEPEIMINLHYQKDNLSEELKSEYSNGTWNESAKTTYSYSEGKLTQTMLYNNIGGTWDIGGKEEVIYKDDSLNTIVEYDYLQGTYYEVWKYESLYEADRIVATTAYHKLEDKWILSFQNTYSYDEDGNLSSESYIQSGITKRSDYIYEDKKGNLGQFIYRGGGATGILLQVPAIQMMQPFQKDNNYAKWTSDRY